MSATRRVIERFSRHPISRQRDRSDGKLSAQEHGRYNTWQTAREETAYVIDRSICYERVMAQDGKHIPSKKFKDNYDRVFRKKKKKKKK